MSDNEWGLSMQRMTMQRLKIVLFVVACSILASTFPATTYSKDKPLPVACTKDCRAPFGEVLGVGKGNVPAYSNCNAKCVVFSPNKKNGTYTGIKWQCVEYARRWLLVNKGVVYGDVDIAADIWGLNYVTRVKDKKKIKMQSFANGSKTKPVVGDKAYLKTGHVAVISAIDSKTHTIDVLEQNFNNTKWHDGYARSISYLKRGGQYWLLDSYLLGWKHVTQQALAAH